jgi:hypothetical protein
MNEIPSVTSLETYVTDLEPKLAILRQIFKHDFKTYRASDDVSTQITDNELAKFQQPAVRLPFWTFH